MRISDWSSDVCSSDLEPRASTTDPDARVMKMADGGFRPAYNVQVISATGTPIVVDVQPATTGSDRGLLRPGLERLRRRFGRLPERYLADGGITADHRSEEHTAELQSLMRITYADLRLKKKNKYI